MQQIPENLDLLLPFGETLRSFLEQPFITPSDLKHTLRARGVFQGRTEKRDTIPVLTCCLLSPAEFDELRQQQVTREDNQKTTTRTLAWNSARTVLDVIPSDLNLADFIDADFTNYKLIGSPRFVAVGGDPDALLFEFEIEREDLSKSWARTKSVFKGSLRIQKAGEGNRVKFVLTHTAEETREVNHRLVQRLHQHFKESGAVRADEEIDAIRFSSFDNEGRISFFRSLADKMQCSDFEFRKMTDLGACPEDQLPLPTNLKWMEDNVSSLSLNGQALQDTFFIKDKSCHRYLLFYAVDADLGFEYLGCIGTCSVRFEFPDFVSSKSRETEFQVNISALSVEPGGAAISKVELKEQLLQRLNDYKLKQFDRYRARPNEIDSADALPRATLPVQLEANLALPSNPAVKRNPSKRLS
jgi:hypothetical protein